MSSPSFSSLSSQTVDLAHNLSHKGLVIAGLSGGSGKSVVSVGLTAALRRAGNHVVAYKKGPDYIDAGWMSVAAASPCYNLDPYLMSTETVRRSFYTHLPQEQSGLALVEGNRGLYDGVTAAGAYSTAELALQLDLPVILVVNCSKTTRTVAAQVLGCAEFDKRIRFAGVVLNQIATTRHESIIRQAIEQYTPLTVVGIIPRLGNDIFPMRHLGVIPYQEYVSAELAVENLADIVEKHIDIEVLLEAVPAFSCPDFSTEKSRASIDPIEPVEKQGHKQAKPFVRIGVLRDASFQFYYQENFEALQALGAELVMIDSLQATSVPATLDALYIGGGFPETNARELAQNTLFRQSVKEASEAGIPIYAECGGLIFLGRSIEVDGTTYPMADVFPVHFGMSEKPQGHGYSRLVVERDNPFYPPGTTLEGHEFRYSTVENWSGETASLVGQIQRGKGFQGGRDGLCKKNTFALYTHVLAGGTKEWAPGLVRAAQEYKAYKNKKSKE